MTLPSVDSTPQQKQKQQRPLNSVAQPPEREIADEQIGYVRRRVDVKMPHKYAMILHNKLRQLQDVGARLSDGQKISDHTKAFLWILENLDAS